MTVITRSYEAPPFDEKEILRYAQCKALNYSVYSLMTECINECRDVFSYNVCYVKVPVVQSGGDMALSFIKTKSEALLKNLNGCSEAIIFGATIGMGIDRLIAKYSRISPSKAMMFQAIGAERIESLCNSFNDEVKAEYESTNPRFSPGYGDFSIETQKDIFKILDCPRKIGLSLNDSMIMSPSKSVTAIIGVRI